MRVGINTGEVVVRSIRKDDLHADYVPVGHSTNLAARMEQMADAGVDSRHRTTRTSSPTGTLRSRSLGADADQRGRRAAQRLRSARRGTVTHAAASRGPAWADALCRVGRVKWSRCSEP